MPSPYDVPSNPPRRFNRADAFAQYTQSQVPNHPDNGMMDAIGDHPDDNMGAPDRVSFVDSAPPVNGYKVPDAPAGGYDQKYAVRSGGAPGSVTQLGNYRSEGGINPSFGVDDEDSAYLAKKYAQQSADWRSQHPDMTGTNGAGQSFSMRQSMPRMRADAAKGFLEEYRLKTESQARQAEAANVSRRADMDATSRNAPVQFALEQARAQSLRDQAERERMAPINETKRLRDEKIQSFQDEQGDLVRQDDASRAAESRKLRPSVGDEQGVKDAEAALKDPSIASNPRYRAFLERRLSGARAKNLGPEAMAMATAKPFDEAQSNIESSIINTPILNAELESLKRSIKDASTRNGLATGVGAVADFVDTIGESITGVKAGQGAASGIGGALAPDLADVKDRFESMADMLVSSGVSPDKQQALQALASMLGRQGEKDDNRDSKAGRQVFSSIRSLSSPIR